MKKKYRKRLVGFVISQMVNSLKVLAENVVNDRIENLGKANDFMRFLVELNGFIYPNVCVVKPLALAMGI